MALEHQWPDFCRVINKEELIKDQRFIDNAARVDNVEELVEEIESWIRSMPDDDAAIAALMEGRIPVAPVLSITEAMDHPHLVERGTIRTISDRVLPDFQVPGCPLRFSEFPEPLELEAPFLGEHNRDVLEHLLGFSEEKIKTLEDSGVLSTESETN